MKTIRIIFSILILFSLGFATTVLATTSKNNLVRCSETGYVGSSIDSCGGDNLTHGVIQVTASGKIAVTVHGAVADPALPFNLYEVYWLPVGQTPSTALLIGNFVTDCNGDSVKNSGNPGTAYLKTIAQAADIKSTSYANIFTLVGNISSGVFLVYDRGPFSNTDTPCNPKKLTEYNTSFSPNDTSATNMTTPFANLAVVPDYRIQFMSGYHN